MERIQIIVDKKCAIRVADVALLINSISETIKIDIVDEKYDLNETVLKYTEAHEKHYKILKPKIKNRLTFLFTDTPYIDNFFFYGYENLIIFSFHEWDILTLLPKENGVLYWLCVLTIRELFTKNIRHDKNTGCANDFLWDKRGIDLGMKQAYLCSSCISKLPALTPAKKKKLEDIKTLLNNLSSSSRWNQSILDKLDTVPSKSVPKKKPLKAGQINVMIASPSDTIKEREILLRDLERNFRKAGYENDLKIRVIPHGWEDLASQTGYPQDVINALILPNVDMVIGLLKHKLGTPTKSKSGKKRADSGTAEEIFYALDKKPNNVLCMLYTYSNAPSPSLDDPKHVEINKNWQVLKKFKDSIRDKVIYKPYSSEGEILEMVTKDLAQNIRTYFK